MAPRFTALLVLGCMLGLPACDEPREQAAAKSAPLPAQKPPEARPNDALSAEVWAWADKDLKGFDPSGEYQRGTLAEGESQDGTVVLQEGRCARVLAVAEASMTDLDLALYDPNGSMVRRETQEGPRAEVGLTFPVCPGVSGVYHVHLVARQGHGAFAWRAYQSPL